MNLDTSILEEDDPIRNRLMGNGDVEELVKLLDDEDEKDYVKFQALRDLASAKYDFTGFDHVNCYNKENFAKGVLEALEKTRRRLSIASAEKLIDFLYIFGYSVKRIIYIIFYCGYINWNRRDVQNYINRHKRRLEDERAKLMKELNDQIAGVFQKMKDNVMASEKQYLKILLDKMEDLTKEMNKCDVTTDEGLARFNKLSKSVSVMMDKCKGMHGIEDIRKASIDIAKNKEIERTKRMLSQGMLDEVLLKEAIPTIEGNPGSAPSPISSSDTKILDLE